MSSGTWNSWTGLLKMPSFVAVVVTTALVPSAFVLAAGQGNVVVVVSSVQVASAFVCNVVVVSWVLVASAFVLTAGRGKVVVVVVVMPLLIPSSCVRTSTAGWGNIVVEVLSVLVPSTLARCWMRQLSFTSGSLPSCCCCVPKNPIRGNRIGGRTFCWSCLYLLCLLYLNCLLWTLLCCIFLFNCSLLSFALFRLWYKSPFWYCNLWEHHMVLGQELTYVTMVKLNE